jgi:hypothetical protein
MLVLVKTHSRCFENIGLLLSVTGFAANKSGQGVGTDLEIPSLQVFLLGILIFIAEDYFSWKTIELSEYETTKQIPNQMVIECCRGSQFTRFRAEAGGSLPHCQ